MNQDIYCIVKNAYLEVMEDQGKLSFDEFTNLMPSSADLDSRDFVMLVVLVEQAVADQFGCQISLVSEAAFSEHKSPFRTAAHFVDFIERAIKGSSDY